MKPYTPKVGDILIAREDSFMNPLSDEEPEKALSKGHSYPVEYIRPNGNFVIIDDEGDPHSYTPKNFYVYFIGNAARALECASACEGIENPAEFIRLAKQLMEVAKGVKP